MIEAVRYARMNDSVYDQFADLEERHFWFRGRRAIFRDLIERALGDDAGDLDLLEIGCGPGGMLAMLEPFGRVHALDIAHESMQMCHRRGFERVVTASGHELPFPDNSFDFVGLFDTIEHIPDDASVLREVARILKPSGTVFLSVPAYQFLFSQNDRLVHHCRRYTRPQMKALLRETGFEPQKSTYFNSFLFPLIMPAVLTVKLKERLVGLPEDQTNLNHEFPEFAHRAFAWFMGSERFLLRNMSFPFGHSLVSIAQPSTTEG